MKDPMELVNQVKMTIYTQSMICPEALFPYFLFISIYFEKLFSSDYSEDIR